MTEILVSTEAFMTAGEFMLNSLVFFFFFGARLLISAQTQERSLPCPCVGWWLDALGGGYVSLVQRLVAPSRHRDTSSSPKAQQLNFIIVGLKVKSASAHRKQI